MMRARLKRQADPYAEESSDPEGDDEIAGEFPCLPCLLFCTIFMPFHRNVRGGGGLVKVIRKVC